MINDTLDVDTENGNKTNHCCWMFLFNLLFFFLGFINNFGFVIVFTGSQKLADSFGHPDLMAFYLLALQCCSSLSRFLNSKLLLKFSYQTRMICISIYSCSAFIIMHFILIASEEGGSLDKSAGFWLSLIPAIIIGTGCAIGESTLLGYLRNYPKNLVSGFSSGTGLAGIIGSGISLILTALEVKASDAYLYLSPILVIYLASFLIVDRAYKKYLSILESEKKKVNLEIFLLTSDGSDTPNMDDYHKNKKFDCVNLKKSVSKAYWYMLNLFAVYFFEYSILSGFCDRVVNKNIFPKQSENFYILLSFCYQCGVFISRSSLPVLKIKHIWIMTLLQFINYILWFVQACFPYIFNVIPLYIHLVFVGLMGGFSYVNCFYFLLNDVRIDSDIKELSVNIATIFNDFGILAASIMNLIFANTFLKL